MSGSVLSLIFAFLTPAILEWLKTKPWLPLINRNTATLNAVFSAVVAVGQAVGLTFAFNQDTGVLTIGGLELTRMAVTTVTAGLAWLLQELTYRASVKDRLLEK